MKNNLAYTAGYLDGDGCFYIGKNHFPVKYRSAIFVTSTNIIICRTLKNQFGGQIKVHKKNPKFKNYNVTNAWYIRGQNAITFCQSVLPYLKEKKEDAKTFFDFFNEKSKIIKEIYIQKVKDHRLNFNLITEDQVKVLNTIQKEGLPNEQDFAYLAGFIDAECNLTISREKPKNRPNTTYKIILQCNNTKSPVIMWLMKTFGGFCYFVSRKNKNSKHKDQVAWRITGKALSSLLPNLLPFLRYKKPVCEQLIEFYATTLPNGGDRQSVQFKTDYLSTISKREAIVANVHKLNSKTITI